MISTQDLTRRFDSLLAVDGLTINVGSGEVFGFLGPNGAGKTTTLRMLSALIAPSSGTAEVAGHKLGADDNLLRGDVGILTETPGLYDRLSAARNLQFFAELYGVTDVSDRVEHYLRLLGLWDRRDDPAGTFSKGMRQKLAIARAVLHRPKVLFLDEPTSGLDPESARMVRSFIDGLRREGRAIFLCTHNLAEADELCDRVAVFNSRLLALDSPANLRRELFGREIVVQLQHGDQRHAEAIKALSFVGDAWLEGESLLALVDEPERHNPELVRCLVELGAQVLFVTENERSLEDVYLKLVRDEQQGESAQEARP
jgi:ABC-2 type transport system ATP-binding protein